MKLRAAGRRWPTRQDISLELHNRRRVPSHIRENRESPVRDKLLINEKPQEPIAVTSNGHLQCPIPTEKRQLRLRTVLLRMGIRLVVMEQLLRG